MSTCNICRRESYQKLAIRVQQPLRPKLYIVVRALPVGSPYILLLRVIGRQIRIETADQRTGQWLQRRSIESVATEDRVLLEVARRTIERPLTTARLEGAKCESLLTELGPADIRVNGLDEAGHTRQRNSTAIGLLVGDAESQEHLLTQPLRPVDTDTTGRERAKHEYAALGPLILDDVRLAAGQVEVIRGLAAEEANTSLTSR